MFPRKGVEREVLLESNGRRVGVEDKCRIFLARLKKIKHARAVINIRGRSIDGRIRTRVLFVPSGPWPGAPKGSDGSSVGRETTVVDTWVMVEDCGPNDSENGDPREKEVANAGVVPLGGTVVDVVGPGGAEFSEGVPGTEGSEALRNPGVTAAAVAGMLVVANTEISGVVPDSDIIMTMVSVIGTTVTKRLVSVSRPSVGVLEGMVEGIVGEDGSESRELVTNTVVDVRVCKVVIVLVILTMVCGPRGMKLKLAIL